MKLKLFGRFIILLFYLSSCNLNEGRDFDFYFKMFMGIPTPSCFKFKEYDVRLSPIADFLTVGVMHAKYKKCAFIDSIKMLPSFEMNHSLNKKFIRKKKEDKDIFFKTENYYKESSTISFQQIHKKKFRLYIGINFPHYICFFISKDEIFIIVCGMRD